MLESSFPYVDIPDALKATPSNDREHHTAVTIPGKSYRVSYRASAAYTATSRDQVCGVIDLHADGDVVQTVTVPGDSYRTAHEGYFTATRMNTALAFVALGDAVSDISDVAIDGVDLGVGDVQVQLEAWVHRAS